ncbi:hypothetical protein BGX27_003022 [Mortierella sp. AM989]|nr:hypothetical protein BGX27_003022 [Mortierella sp. AM989]
MVDLRSHRISPQQDQQQKYTFSSDVEKSGHEGSVDQEMMAVDEDADVDVEIDTAQEPAIFRLSPELLAQIFHYVYVTPVVHRPASVQNEQQQNCSQPPQLSQTSSSSSSTSLVSSPSNTASTSETTTTITASTSDPSTVTGERRKKNKRKSAVYIQNDLSSMLALCLTCRTFYPQAIRMLWRQRTLASNDELAEFYQAIDFCASLRKPQQKQRQLEQQQQRPGMDYAVEEGLFNNEAALRIKSLTLLDMTLGSTLPLGTAADTTSTLNSSQFFGSSNNHGGPTSAGVNLNLCQGIDMLAGVNTVDGDSSSTSYTKDTRTASSSSSSSFSGQSGDSSTVSKRRLRQKTTSIYSELISPRLLYTIANHCYALVDLTICVDSKPLAIPNFSGPEIQPSIPLSIIAGALLSLKRLTLMGLICDPQRNKTGSELLIFAQNTQPLERISIRSCRGISLETYIEFAVRSHGRLLSLDYQGLDFESSQQLTDMMSAYAQHCKNIKSVTLSCLNALSLDGMMEALALHGASELQELHVLGHDSFRTSQQQQQQQEVLVAQPQQPQAGVVNNNQDGLQVPFTQMCHLADATVALSNLSKLPLRHLTLYCPGITDFALFQYIRHSQNLTDLVLNEPTSILQHPQFQAFVQSYLPQTQNDDAAAAAVPQEEENVFGPVVTTPPSAPFTSAGFFGLVFDQCPWLKFMFMKLTLETAQEWVVQPCFKEAGLDKCLYQYRTATGTPAVVLMWDARNKAQKNNGMEIAPEYQLVFLNELHDKLKQLDPRRNRIAGLYRILGRLTDFDIYRQIAKVESCFHHQYTPAAPVRSSPSSTKHEAPLSGRASNKDTIDLTMDEDEDDGNPDQNQDQTVVLAANSIFIDLTSSADEEDNTDEINHTRPVAATSLQKQQKDKRKPSTKDDLLPRNIREAGSEELSQHTRQNANIPKGGPKIILWIDTHLLGQWKYEPRALFQFMGEVAFEAGHWILQARTCRNMEGLDLYTYQKSIMLTRDLMRRNVVRQTNDHAEHSSAGGS